MIEDIENSTAGGQQIINGGKYNSSMLMSKLQLAVKQIKQLALEKQQLIEVGNRLRAELNKNGTLWFHLVSLHITCFPN